MKPQAFIPNNEIILDTERYTALYREYGHIQFQLTLAEMAALIVLANEFKEIENQEPGFDKESWLKDNMNFDVPEKSLSVFAFLVMQWTPETGISSVQEGEKSDFVVVTISSKSL
jgi:hypothetical protein